MNYFNKGKDCANNMVKQYHVMSEIDIALSQMGTFCESDDEIIIPDVTTTSHSTLEATFVEYYKHEDGEVTESKSKFKITVEEIYD